MKIEERGVRKKFLAKLEAIMSDSFKVENYEILYYCGGGFGGLAWF